VIGMRPDAPKIGDAGLWIAMRRWTIAPRFY
jgi:hypothetical protein